MNIIILYVCVTCMCLVSPLIGKSRRDSLRSHTSTLSTTDDAIDETQQKISSVRGKKKKAFSEKMLTAEEQKAIDDTIKVTNPKKALSAAEEVNRTESAQQMLKDLGEAFQASSAPKDDDDESSNAD